MFATNRELVSKAKKGTRADAVAKAKAGREERKQQREASAMAVKIQAIVRGFVARSVLAKTQRADFDSKHTDICRIKTLLRNKGIIFVTPTDAALTLLKRLLFFSPSEPHDVSRFQNLINDILLDYCDPSKTQLLSQFISSLASFPGLFRCIIKKLLTFVYHLQNGFNCFKFLYSMLGLELGQEYDASTEANLTTLRHLMCVECGVFVRAREYLLKHLKRERNHLRNMNTDLELEVEMMGRPHVFTKEYSASADALFCLCIGLVLRDADQAEWRSKRFVREVLSIPVLTCGLSLQTCSFFATSGAFSTCIHSVDTHSLDLAPAPSSTFSSEVWYFGNMVGFFTGSSFGAHVQPNTSTILPTPIDPVPTGQNICETVLDTVEEATLVHLLSLFRALAHTYTPTGLLAGTAAVRWTTVGVVSEATAPPPQLRQQFGGLISTSCLRSLYVRTIFLIDESILDTPSSSSDADEVDKARRSTGVEIARQEVIGQSVGGMFQTITNALAPKKWISSRWAERLLGNVSNAFSSTKDQQTRAGSQSESKSGETISPSSTAMDLNWSELQPPPGKIFVYSPALTRLWCEIYSAILPPFFTDAVGGALRATAISTTNHPMWRFLNSLVFSTHFVRKSWALLRYEGVTSFSSTFSPARDLAPRGISATLALFLVGLSHSLVATDDVEMYERNRPFPLHNFVTLVRCLKTILYDIIRWQHTQKDVQPETRVSSEVQQAFESSLSRVCASIMRALYDRGSRRGFCLPATWRVDETDSHRIMAELRGGTPLGQALLRTMPFAVDFKARMQLFKDFVEADKRIHQPEGSKGVVIRIRRQLVLEDGLRAMDRLGSSIKQRIVVRYINDFGEEEVGIDMGGLFKDFWTDLSASIFSADVGLFRLTSDRLLYPNPSAKLLHPDDYLNLFEFLGRILGKALYEGITVQPQFAHFFLAFMRSRYNFLDLFNDLSTLDYELYKNLMFLKTYEGDIADLCLTFVVAADELDGSNEVELVHGGSSMAVTSSNKHRYVNLVAKYHLHDKIKDYAEAFVKGLYDVIQPSWFFMFSPPELQVLITGARTTISAEDLKQHTRYSGGFHAADRTVRRFWSTFESLDETQRAQLIKFVTSCERPPPLGFGALDPPFTIHRVPISRDEERLPTASTCFNILKLPTYSSERVLKEKLLMAITSGAGFDLS